MQLQNEINLLKEEYEKTKSEDALINLIATMSISFEYSHAMKIIKSINTNSNGYQKELLKVKEMLFKLKNNIEFKQVEYYFEHSVYKKIMGDNDNEHNI